jgi:ferritin
MKEVPPIPFTIISGTEVEYDGTAIVQWFKTHQIESFKKANEISDKRQAQLKDLKARASLLEIELTKVQAELVSAKEVAKEWLAETRVLEDKLSALASKLATVDSSKSYQERKDAYQSIVDALLDDLAN